LLGARGEDTCPLEAEVFRVELFKSYRILTDILFQSNLDRFSEKKVLVEHSL
jgi:hypothetical protein